MAAGSEYRAPISIPVETNAPAASDSIRDLRDSIASSKESIKATAAALRDMRGSTDEVKAAKDQLRAKLEAEKAAISAATLQMVKQGTTVDDLAKKERAAADLKKSAADVEKKRADDAAKKEKATADLKKKADDVEKKRAEAGKKQQAEAKQGSDALAKSIGAAGGPVASLKDKLGSMNDVLGGSEGGMAALAGIAALAAAAVVAVGAAAISATIALAKFVIVSADAARMMQLTRKANLAGNDQWATNLRDQVDAIARNIPVAKDKLNELGIALAKSRIGGQTMVDTMKAVGGATSAAGDDLGNKLKGIVERGAFTKRFQLSPQELLGMDLDFNDVAKAYATGMHVSVEAARQALFEGRVRLSDGAKALKDAVEAKFGGINAEKMLGIDNQVNKLREDLAALAKDVDLKPLLEGIKKLLSNFDQASVNGKALKGIITTIGNAIGVSFAGGVPLMQDFIDKAVYGALKLENYWLRADIAFKKLTHGMELGSAIGQSVIKGLGMSISGDSSLMVLLDVWSTKGPAAANACRDLKNEITGLQQSLKDAFTGSAWFKNAGKDIVDGIGEGIDAGATELMKKVTELADKVKYAFTGALKIRSPSKVFEEYGKQTTAGYAQGVEAGAPSARAAVGEMVPTKGDLGASSASSSSSSGGGIVIQHLAFTFAPQITGDGDARTQLLDPALWAEIKAKFLSELRAAGIEVPA